MANLISAEAVQRKAVLQKCWGYLLDNFHKLSESHKIRVAISLCTKDMPTVLEGQPQGGSKVVVFIKEVEKKEPIETVNGDQGQAGRLPASVSVIPS